MTLVMASVIGRMRPGSRANDVGRLPESAHHRRQHIDTSLMIPEPITHGEGIRAA